MLLLTLFTGLIVATGIRAAESGLFDEPDRVCGALREEGLPAGRWDRGNQGFQGTQFTAYNCLSAGYVIQGGDSPFVTSINYFAEGRTRDRVEIVKLVLNVHDRKTRDAGRTKFIAVSKRLFGALGITASPGVLQALDQARGGDFTFDGGRIRFEVWKLPVERERLTIEAATVLRR